jgi:hypothetical protein
MTSTQEKHKTLGEYRDLWARIAAPDSAALRWLDTRILERGRDEIVRAPEEQTRLVLGNIEVRGTL